MRLTTAAIAFVSLVTTALAAPGDGTRRVALVIGNAAYESARLSNPVNDARAMAKALEGCGFAVTKLEDADLRQMKEAVARFGAELRGGGTGLFYFSGHGMQVKGRNFLVPVGAKLGSESETEYETLDAGRVLGAMEDAGNAMNLVILDACRDNPFARSFRSARHGLAMMDAPSGTLIAYATSPGSTADDNVDGSTGLYTTYLLKHLARPGLKVEELLKSVRVDVSEKSAKKQIPWEASSLVGDFYFVAPSASPPPSPVAPAAPATPESPPPPPSPTPAPAASARSRVAEPAPAIDGSFATVDMMRVARALKVPVPPAPAKEKSSDLDRVFKDEPGIRRRVLEQLEGIAAARGLAFVFERQWIYHPRSALDLTDELIAACRGAGLDRRK